MVHIQSHLVVVVPENVRRWLWTEGLVLFIKVHCWSSYTLYDIYCTQFCLLKCIVGIIQGGFFNWSALKMTKCQTLRKF